MHREGHYEIRIKGEKPITIFGYISDFTGRIIIYEDMSKRKILAVVPEHALIISTEV